MTREQALTAMMEGNKITHRYFSKDEYYEMKRHTILAEDGVTIPVHSFQKVIIISVRMDGKFIMNQKNRKS